MTVLHTTKTQTHECKLPLANNTHLHRVYSVDGQTYAHAIESTIEAVGDPTGFPLSSIPMFCECVLWFFVCSLCVLVFW